MPRKKEYWRVVYNYTPYYCRPITYSAVISEKVETFLSRNKNSATHGDSFNLLSCTQTTEQQYTLTRKCNPSKGSYGSLKEEDYGN